MINTHEVLCDVWNRVLSADEAYEKLDFVEIDQLEAENAALREKVAAAREACGDYICDGMSLQMAITNLVAAYKDRHEIASVYSGQLTECERQLSAAQKDAERIDFIEQVTKNSRTGVGFDYCKHVEDGQVTEQGIRMLWYYTPCERKPNVRSAIDAAIEQEKE